jgi:plasmid stabilization system protein ParE
MTQVKWTLQALDDVEAICLFIARDAPKSRPCSLTVFSGLGS